MSDSGYLKKQEKNLARKQKNWQALLTLVDPTMNAGKVQPAEAVEALVDGYYSALNDAKTLQHSRRETGGPGSQNEQELPELLPDLLKQCIQSCYLQLLLPERNPMQRVIHWFCKALPQAIRNNLGFIGISLMFFMVGTLIARQTVIHDPATEVFFMPAATIAALDNNILWTDQVSASLAEATMLMTHNIQVALYAFITGLFFGLGALFLSFHNGMFALGGPLEVCFQHGMGVRLIQFMVAHGFIELCTIFTASAAGYKLGIALLFPGEKTRFKAVEVASKEALILLAGCVVLLVAAGCIEGLISLNTSMGWTPRITIGAISAVLLILYVWRMGRD
ncbi:MAG: stage II sporulation protein M [Cyanobacteria bacterium P01_H01_bin.74]